MDEHEEGQERTEGVFVENQMDIKEGEKRNGNDSGKGNTRDPGYHRTSERDTSP